MSDINDYLPVTGWNSDTSIAKLWLVICNRHIVLSDQNNWLWQQVPGFLEDALEYFVCGQVDGRSIAIVSIQEPPEDRLLIPVRQLLAGQGAACFNLLSHALQLLTARDEQRFCSRCGSLTAPRAGEWSQQCQSCQALFYPVISPCVIVVIKKQNDILLVRHNRHGKNSTMHTLVAGFVEPGESAEQAVIREVYEETGLSVDNVKFQFSQSWPFPHSLMLGFHADYAGGDLKLEEAELCDGGWFSLDNLPELPPEFTISRQLVKSLL